MHIVIYFLKITSKVTSVSIDSMLCKFIQSYICNTMLFLEIQIKYVGV